SKSLGRRWSRRSRTPPPTRYETYPCRSSRLRTFTASASRNSVGSARRYTAGLGIESMEEVCCVCRFEPVSMGQPQGEGEGLSEPSFYEVSRTLFSNMRIAGQLRDP